MNNAKGVAQNLLKYEVNDQMTHCGMTYFQCGVSPIVIFTDLDQQISITNSIESAATSAHAMHFLEADPKRVMFIEHYRRAWPDPDTFHQVKMDWDWRNERYKDPQFIRVTTGELEHLLGCYGYDKRNLPKMDFLKADVIQFRPVGQLMTV